MNVSENSNSTYENIAKAKEILLKASNNPKFSKYITEEKIQEALSNIIICKDDEDFIRQVDLVVPGALKKDPSIYGLQAFQAVESKKIFYRNNCSIEQIIHDVVHYFSLDDKGTGILNIGEEIIADKGNNAWNKVNPLHIDALNEAMTHYITQELLPEIKVEDAYSYGAKFLKDYTDATGNMDKIFDAYFGKDKDALDFIAKDVNKEGIISWHDMLEAIGRDQYLQMGIFRHSAANLEVWKSDDNRIKKLTERIKNRNKNSSELVNDDEPELI